MIRRTQIVIIGIIVLVIASIAVFFIVLQQSVHKNSSSEASATITKPKVAPNNPLAGKVFYRDDARLVTQLAIQNRDTGSATIANDLSKIAQQPGTTWLVGPNQSDPAADNDIGTVIRTSTEAAAAASTPVYELYAIPQRDACAAYSKGGFENNDDYLVWIDRILSSLKTPAVFLVETDAIANIVADRCLSNEQVLMRELLLAETIKRLKASPNAVAVYLDAGHAEWFSDPSVLVEPLKRSGIQMADGITVNTSFFDATKKTADWSGKLIDELGGDKGVVIDTSRNGNGAAPSNVKGEARWCNPVGRALGEAPSTKTIAAHIHAYLWIKNVGESDGSCFGNPPAGTFSQDLALDIVRNTQPKTN